MMFVLKHQSTGFRSAGVFAACCTTAISERSAICSRLIAPIYVRSSYACRTATGRDGKNSPPYSTRSRRAAPRSEEHTSELQSLMRISYAVFCLKTKKTKHQNNEITKNINPHTTASH